MARIGQTCSHRGTHAAHKSPLISLQTEQNQTPPALLALIERISGHEPTGKGEVHSCPRDQRRVLVVQVVLLEFAGSAMLLPTRLLR